MNGQIQYVQKTQKARKTKLTYDDRGTKIELKLTKNMSCTFDLFDLDFDRVLNIASYLFCGQF